MSVRAISRSFYGTEWRVVGRWKDLGGVDGMEYVTDLDFYRHGGWHTDGSWTGETFRAIPAAVLEWASVAAWSLTERAKS